jgi:hypothetical protein
VPDFFFLLVFARSTHLGPPSLPLRCSCRVLQIVVDFGVPATSGAGGATGAGGEELRLEIKNELLASAALAVPVPPHDGRVALFVKLKEEAILDPTSPPSVRVVIHLMCATCGCGLLSAMAHLGPVHITAQNSNTNPLCQTLVLVGSTVCPPPHLVSLGGRMWLCL